MTSVVRFEEWQEPTGTTAATVDSSGNVAFSGNVSVDGVVLNSEAWQSAAFGTNFTNYSTAYESVEFRREADIVRVRGLAKATATVGVTEVIFTLPTGYRPPDDLVMATVCASGSTAPAIAVIEVKPTGIVMLGGGMSMVNGNYITLNFTFAIS